MLNTYKRQRTQSGAVSLFVVIFAALLMTVVTISFVQLMVKDQQQATTSDLSQSAYDSAQAGVEDAKRLLLLDQSCRNNPDFSERCDDVAAALTPAPGSTETACGAIARGLGIGDPNTETLVQQSAGSNDSKLDQAYTCVKIGVDTGDFKGEVAANQTSLVPLQGTSDFDTVELSWFTKTDVAGDDASANPTIGFPSTGTDVNLPPVGDKWKVNYPALMRTQFMQTGSRFTLSDFDNSQPDNKSNANTLFLYPASAGTNNKSFALDGRRSPTNAPQPVRCQQNFVTSEYACTVRLTIPTPIDGSATRNAFLRLSALYNGAHFQVKLLRGSAEVPFKGVQPVVDSTGRANDLFRRVQARVQLTSDMTYPDAVIDLDGDLCKNFTVTNDDNGYSGSATCTP
jgi:Tfp pilus assembly protein PilX